MILVNSEHFTNVNYDKLWTLINVNYNEHLTNVNWSKLWTVLINVNYNKLWTSNKIKTLINDKKL